MTIFVLGRVGVWYVHLLEKDHIDPRNAFLVLHRTCRALSEPLGGVPYVIVTFLHIRFVFHAHSTTHILLSHNLVICVSGTI
jgi:hypothetical protein